MCADIDEAGRLLERSAVAAGLDQLARLAIRRPGAPRDISFTTASTLSRLEDEGPRRLTSLAVDEGVAQPSMTQLIQRLERQGLVERTRDADDKRVVWVGITEAGRRLLAKRRSARAAELAELLATLPPDEEAALATAVRAALPVIRKLAERRAPATDAADAADAADAERKPLTSGQDR
jgi:DNA-binding MarR family transcriptional regulator